MVTPAGTAVMMPEAAPETAFSVLLAAPIPPGVAVLVRVHKTSGNARPFSDAVCLSGQILKCEIDSGAGHSEVVFRAGHDVPAEIIGPAHVRRYATGRAVAENKAGVQRFTPNAGS